MLINILAYFLVYFVVQHIIALLQTFKASLAEGQKCHETPWKSVLTKYSASGLRK